MPAASTLGALGALGASSSRVAEQVKKAIINQSRTPPPWLPPKSPGGSPCCLPSRLSMHRGGFEAPSARSPARAHSGRSSDYLRARALPHELFPICTALDEGQCNTPQWNGDEWSAMQRTDGLGGWVDGWMGGRRGRHAGVVASSLAFFSATGAASSAPSSGPRAIRSARRSCHDGGTRHDGLQPPASLEAFFPTVIGPPSGTCGSRIGQTAMVRAACASTAGQTGLVCTAVA